MECTRIVLPYAHRALLLPILIQLIMVVAYSARVEAPAPIAHESLPTKAVEVRSTQSAASSRSGHPARSDARVGPPRLIFCDGVLRPPGARLVDVYDHIASRNVCRLTELHICMAARPVAVHPPSLFDDLPLSHDSYSIVKRLGVEQFSHHKIQQGKCVTRYEMTVMLARILNQLSRSESLSRQIPQHDVRVFVRVCEEFADGLQLLHVDMTRLRHLKAGCK